jgi:iron complex outermembrane receptor protein
MKNFSYDAIDMQTRAEYTAELINTKYKITGELGYSNLYGDMLDPATDKTVGRAWQSLGLSLQYGWGGKGDDQTLSMITSVRGDHFSDHGLLPSFSQLISLNLFKGMSLNVEPSYNFRVPSFNELYYLNYGNQNLDTEKSISLPMDIMYNYNISEDWLLAIDVGVFAVGYREMILSIPTSPVTISAQNIGRSRSYGSDVGISLYSNNLTLDIGYLLQRSEELRDGNYYMLPYVPQEIITANLFYEIGNVDASVSSRYNSFRFATRGESPYAFLRSFVQLDINIGYDLTFSEEKVLGLSIFADNILGESYQLITNYPMPGRLFGLGLELRAL